MMNNSKRNEHLSLKRMMGILLLICTALFVAACSQSGTAEENEVAKKSDPAVKDKEAIQAVIEKEFNGPDKKYRELWETAMDFQTEEMNQEEYDAFQETPEYKELMNYMEEAYAPYFTENAYETFSRTAAFTYSFSEEDYTINTADLEINQSKNEPTLYNFAFNVNYEDENDETADYAFEGNAIVPEEGKIGKIEFDDLDRLNQAIQE